MKISHLLRTAALGLPVLGTAPVQGFSLTPPPLAPEVSPFTGPPPHEPDNRCAQAMPSYSDQDLQSINAALGDLRQWIVDHDPVDTGSRMAGFDAVFAAGTERGKDYLSQNPGNIIAVIDAYRDHIASLAPTQTSGFGESEKAKMAWLEKVMQQTLVAIVVYTQTECRVAPALRAPSP